MKLSTRFHGHMESGMVTPFQPSSGWAGMKTKEALLKLWRGSIFWKICGVWALVLVSFALARPYLFPMQMEVAVPEGYLPSTGETLTLPDSLLTTTGDALPALENTGQTLFLVTSASCPACKRELTAGSFHELLNAADEGDVATRMLVIPAGSEETDWYMNRVPSTAPIVLDTMDLAITKLRSRVTPSVVVVGPGRHVSFAEGWPVTWEVIEAGLD